ncbi:hypothetical protein [Porphyromonas macacae]|uniref:hypothetical protein n=1 Tax=Porphyromonas macacae TaxID=28115 RepID=UPI0024AE22BD|nr:hypothetical protein [Porphyromonas macacae]
MKNNTKTNSFGRIGLLLRMEWQVSRKNILIFTLLSVLVLAGLRELFYNLFVPRIQIGGVDVMSLYQLFSLIFWFYGFILLNKRVNRSDTIDYCQIPAKTCEKYVVLCLYIVFFIFLAWVANQLCYSINFMFHPHIGDAARIERQIFGPVFANGYQILIPWNFSDMKIKEIYLNTASIGISSLIFSLGTTLFCLISFRKTIKALFACMGIGLVFIILIIVLITQVVKSLEGVYEVADIQALAEYLNMVMTTGFVIFGLAFMGLSYYKLKKRQLK